MKIIKGGNASPTPADTVAKEKARRAQLIAEAETAIQQEYTDREALVKQKFAELLAEYNMGLDISVMFSTFNKPEFTLRFIAEPIA